MKHIYSLLIVVSIFYQSSFGQCGIVTNLVTNGSFMATLGSNITAPGWIGWQSPDINNASGVLYTTPCYYWIGTPLPSIDGGTWQNLYGFETISQNINLIPGQDYQMCFEYAAQGIQCVPFYILDQPIGIEVFLNNTSVFTTPDDTTQYTWETACFTFTAPSSQVTLKIGTTQLQYIGLDGICLTPLTSMGNQPPFEITEVFPNPFNNELHVRGTGKSSTIQLFDINSKVILSGSLDDGYLNTSSLTPGIYFYRIENHHGHSRTGKLIKE